MNHEENINRHVSFKDDTFTPLNRKDAGPNIQRNPSFLTVNRDIYTRHASLELLNPSATSPLRKSSISIAIFNLIATVCGGGVLTLPYAFSIVGIIPATILMIFSAVITDFSLYILCSCARRTGGKSYGDIAKHAFGPMAEMGTTLLLFFLCGFILIAYMVLIKGVTVPVILFLFPGVKELVGHGGGDEEDIMERASDYILLLILVVVSPLLLKRDLYSLRNTCYVGVVSLIVLCFGLVYSDVQVNVVQDPTLFHTKFKLYTTDFWEIVFAFPIVALSFLSSFNVLSVHGALKKPSRKRIRAVLDLAVLTCLILFYVVGLCGYLYAYDNTKDNIFLNFKVSNKALLIGRAGYCVTLVFGLPLVMLPTREALLSLPDQWKSWSNEKKVAAAYNLESIGGDEKYIVNGVNFDEEKSLLKNAASADSLYDLGYDSVSNRETLPSDAYTNIAQQQQQQQQILRLPTVTEYILHYGSTFCITVTCYIVAVSVPGVALVWSIAGSFMAILIAYVIPAACYLKLRSHKGWNKRSIGAWALLAFSSVACALCTGQTIWTIVKDM